jgi:hypothetical protein
MQTATYKRRTKSYHDVVREDSIPVLFNFVGTLCRPPDLSRKLKPMRNQQRAKAPLHTKHKIVINIQSATNLPEKVNGEPTNMFVDVLFRVNIGIYILLYREFRNNALKQLRLKVATQGKKLLI